MKFFFARSRGIATSRVTLLAVAVLLANGCRSPRYCPTGNGGKEPIPGAGARAAQHARPQPSRSTRKTAPAENGKAVPRETVLPEPDDLPPVKPIRIKKGNAEGLFDDPAMEEPAPGPGRKGTGKAAPRDGDDVPGPEKLIDSIEVDKDNAGRTIEAEGRDVLVSASGGTVVITGACGRLTVTGERNTIRCDAVRLLEISGHRNELVLDSICAGAVSGDRNRVSWKRGAGETEPLISSTGSENEIVRLPAELAGAAPPAPASAGNDPATDPSQIDL